MSGAGPQRGDIAHIDWIPAGTRFGAGDMAYYAGRGERDVDDALGEIDLIVTGPHATAAFPAEMQPFVESRFTKRLQYDFTDVSTSPVARRWAENDPHVLYIENPHPRAVRDANRPRPADVAASLREVFDRLEAAGEGERPSLAGADAIRPVTFGYMPVLRRPETDAEWDQLVSALTVAGTLGVDEYERVRQALIERVVEAKLRRLATLDPAETTVAGWNSATTLDLLSIHDTMNHTAQPDGAICVERKVADRLPNLVALSNRAMRGESSPPPTKRACATRSPSPRSTPRACAASPLRIASRSTHGRPTTSASTAPTSGATRRNSPGRCCVLSSLAPSSVWLAAHRALCGWARGRTSSFVSSSSARSRPPR